MGCPGLSALWASGAASMYLWSRGEKEVEVLRRLPAARGRIAAGLHGIWETSLRRRPTGLPESGQKCRSEIRFSAVRTALN